MSEEQVQPDVRGLSPGLLRAIAARQRYVEVDTPIVEGDDLSDLKRLLRADPNPEIDGKRAIGTLARSERSADAATILEEILRDVRRPATIRAAAALGLGGMPPEVAERSLLRGLDCGDDRVQSAVLTSIAQMGTAEALARLRDLPEPEDESARRQLSLARLAVGLRTGAPREQIDGELSVFGVGWHTEEARQVEPKRVRACVAALGDVAYGLKLDPAVAWDVGCGGVAQLLLISKELELGAVAEQVSTRSLLAGLIAVTDDERGYAAVRYLVMTTPSATGCEVFVARPTGDVVYAGSAERERESLRLTLRDVGVARVPTTIEARVSGREISVSIRSWGGARRRSAQGEVLVETQA